MIRLTSSHKSGTLCDDIHFLTERGREMKISQKSVNSVVVESRVFIYISSSWFIVLFKSSVSLPILCLVFLSIHMH